MRATERRGRQSVTYFPGYNALRRRATQTLGGLRRLTPLKQLFRIALLAGLNDSGESTPLVASRPRLHEEVFSFRMIGDIWQSVGMQIRRGRTPKARELSPFGCELSRTGQLRLVWMSHYLGHARNAAATCRHFGISRQTFYRWWRRYETLTISPVWRVAPTVLIGVASPPGLPRRAKPSWRYVASIPAGGRTSWSCCSAAKTSSSPPPWWDGS